MGKILLPLRAKHFHNTEYFPKDGGNCAIEKAAIDHFGTKKVSECVDLLVVDRVNYNHFTYSSDRFDHDEAQAISLQYDDTVIRIIELTKCKPCLINIL